jgi:hypothetical protein
MLCRNFWFIVELKIIHHHVVQLSTLDCLYLSW